MLASAGVEGFTSQEDQEMISRVEKQLKRRFAIGSQVSEHSIVQDFTKQVGASAHLFGRQTRLGALRLCGRFYRSILNTPSTRFCT